MIRLIQRRLIIPRGDTGSFTIPMLENVSKANTIAIFSIFNMQEIIYQQRQPVTEDTITFTLEYKDTKDLRIGKYNWDVKIYTNPEYNKNNELINGDEVHSYYAAFKLPECEIVPFSLYKRG